MKSSLIFTGACLDAYVNRVSQDGLFLSYFKHKTEFTLGSDVHLTVV